MVSAEPPGIRDGYSGGFCRFVMFRLTKSPDMNKIRINQQ